MRLIDLPPLTEALITEINVNKELTIRLYNMGFDIGNKVKIIRKAPLLDPIEIYTRGFYLALRVKDAKNINVELL